MARNKGEDEYVEARSISMEKRVWNTLDKMNDRTGLPVSRIIQRAVKAYLKKHRDTLKKRGIDGFMDDFMMGD